MTGPRVLPAACQPGLKRGARGGSPRLKKRIQEAHLPHSRGGYSSLLDFPHLAALSPPSSLPGTSENSLSRAKFAPPCPEGELAQKNHKIQSNTHPEIPQDEIPPKFSSPPIFIHTHTYPHLVLAVARRRSSIRRAGIRYFSNK